MNTYPDLLYMCLILLAAATLFITYVSRGAGRIPTAPISPSPQLLAVDTLWSAGGRATGPAIRTPADGPGRSRSAP